MKKLLFVFVTLFALVLTSGCGTEKNTVRFDGDDKADILATGENTTDDKEATKDAAVTDGEKDEKATDNSDSAATITPTGKLAVTSFDGAYLKTIYSYNVVKGDAPAGTRTIKINDYKLSKYIGGQTKWDYIASTRFATLKSGLNTYVVKALDKEGKEIDSLIFSINYDAPTAPNILPGVGASHWLTLLSTLMMVGVYTVFRKYRWL